MAPIPEAMDLTISGREWMAAALGVVLTACVSLSIALIVVLCGSKQKEEQPKEENPPAPAGGDAAPAGDAAPPEEPKKEPSAKEPPAAGSAKGSAKGAPSQTTGPSAKGPELKLTSEKAATTIGGKSGKGGMVDLKKQPSLQLQASTTKK